MKNKRLFKNLTASALTLTSVLAFSSTAFAAPVQFDDTNNATITNTLNIERTLTFKKVFKGGNFTSWAERKAADSKLETFEDADKFNDLFEITRSTDDSFKTKDTLGIEKDSTKSVLDTSNYKVVAGNVTRNTDGSDEITYTIEVDSENDQGLPYKFKIAEKPNATTHYKSSNQKD